ncbi:AarF/ABC1/UbiB kinase family protein [Rhodohalobacter sp. SW132]|uniref:ABC1 kinase family protein n=1 Tax=Rhodohalobacter sp. SW132 TaxID=2293433 RepID=UPI000E265AA2|nr:AarF/ABC1/UbiB kinase family protein [Rhodohalobacter sp. SW132]REL24592.1 AarF/ABC1/UbiB kinase family protein [Rhodohalobacter sp. SW132]
MSDFPSSKYDRGKIFAKTGLKVGSNYAKHYLKSLRGSNSEQNSQFYNQTAQEILTEFTKLRGTALKIAQSLSIDQGFLPDEFAEAMTQAQYSVPPINRSLVRSIIKRELGSYPETLFASFETEASAAASIGQVHRATLKDGRKVAVKIQYPGVRDTITTDLGLAKTLFRRFIKNSDELDEYFREIESSLRRETDYIAEGESINRFHERFAGEKFETPQWVEEYSTERVLTMTFIEGNHLNEFLKTEPSQTEKDRYGQLLWDFFHQQIQEFDEIHADTHPGNFLLTPDGKLGIIDFGCVKTFPPDFFKNYLLLLPTHLDRDIDAIIKLYKELSVLKTHPDEDPKEKRYFDFCINYGYTFAMPYESDKFDFGDPEYKELIRGYTKNAPIGNEARGNKHFIYSTRVHLGLYHFLMKIGAQIDTRESRNIVADAIKTL